MLMCLARDWHRPRGAPALTVVGSQMLTLPLSPPGCRWGTPSWHLVVDVEVSLIFILHDHAGFLQQKVGDLAPIWLSATAELDLKVLALNPREPRQPHRGPGVQPGEGSGMGLTSLSSFPLLPT